MAITVERVPQIPDYDLIRVIGSGSYGDVWLARGVTGAFRAVKIVWRERFNDPLSRAWNGAWEVQILDTNDPGPAGRACVQPARERCGERPGVKWAGG